MQDESGVPPERDEAPPERNLGPQPLARRMEQLELRPADLVAASEEQLTHKMVSRAMKGRRLTANTMGKIVRAFSSACGEEIPPDELFDYAPLP